jgi:Tol biopolymer transport system component
MSIVKNGFPFLIIPSITILMVISLWFLSNLEFNNERKAILPPEKFLDKIAYIGHDRQLYIINPDGSRLNQISNTFESNFSWPTWSASNKLLAYTVSSNNPNKSDPFFLKYF